MAKEFKRAKTIAEVALQTIPEPLQSGDARYVDLCAGRGITELKQMRLHIQDQDASQNRYAWIALIGHRGSGKTTELYRLEHDLADRFTPVHLFADEDLLSDFDFTDMLLWTAEAVARTFAEDPGLGKLNAKLVEGVAGWFAERTQEKVEAFKSEVKIETGARAKAGFSVLGLGIGMFARLKSILKGQVERRDTIRQNLRRYASELVDNVNLLLDAAAGALQRAGRPPDLLLVQDNLDRLQAEPARRLFFDSADFLRRLHAHTIYTAPIAMVLAPWSIGRVFDNVFSMPMVKTHDRANKPFTKGLKALEKALEHRVAIENVFAKGTAVRELARMSGGSMRDLLRLLNYAQLEARTRGRDRIDLKAVRAAAGKMRLEYERLLIPGQAYYPLLAAIHWTKRDPLGRPAELTPEAVASQRAFLCEMLFSGSVLEYNGGESWMDVHPVLQDIPAFKDAVENLKKPTAPSPPGKP